jgi:hypothetical protein
VTSLSYRAPPTLARFMRSNEFIRCVVGPVGSGKSSVCCMEVLRRAAEQRTGPDNVRRTRFVVIRNTYRELKDTTRKTFEQWVPPALGRWREQDFSFTIEQPLADGTSMHCEVLFRALDSPEDVKKLLSLELTGAYINEARQVPKSILDVLSSRVGRYPSKAQGGASWFGVWMDTNPWHTGHWGFKLFSKQKPEGHALWEQPDGLGPAAENLENLPDGYYPRLCLGKDTEWIDEYVRSKYPAYDKGSVYGHLLAAIEARGGLLAYPHEATGLHTWWDLGRADSTSFWVTLLRPGGVDVVDHYTNHGLELSHYFRVLDEREKRGHRYACHHLPHDARAKTLTTKRSVAEQFADKYGPARVRVVPALDVDDGIAAARSLLEGDIRFHTRCTESPEPGIASGWEALSAYKYQWNETLQTFSRVPLHDWASHPADAFRTLATGLASVAPRAEPPPPTKKIDTRRPTMTEMWEDAERRRER